MIRFLKGPLQPDLFPGTCSGCLERRPARELAVRFAYRKKGLVHLDLCVRCLVAWERAERARRKGMDAKSAAVLKRWRERKVASATAALDLKGSKGRAKADAYALARVPQRREAA